MQKDNDLKHDSNSTTEWLKKKRINVLQRPKLKSKPHDLKRAVHKWMAANLNELMHCC